jgi:O-acetyl-ADP-ribose deacetylase (regulator of RNase III)
VARDQAAFARYPGDVRVPLNLFRAPASAAGGGGGGGVLCALHRRRQRGQQRRRRLQHEHAQEPAQAGGARVREGATADTESGRRAATDAGGWLAVAVRRR